MESSLLSAPLSVTELSHQLKSVVEGHFSRVQVRGEISGCTHHGSGHIYLCLKDDKSVMDGVCWRGTAGRLSLTPQDGIEVIATGRLTTYPGRSKYQIIIEEMTLAGEGALLKLLEARRRQLAAEGLFADELKKPLPYMPQKIGIITSPTGAVIQDILHRLSERCPRPVLLWPVAVQGDGAADQIVAALDGFNALPDSITPPDVILVARGGGSLEDLWAFNEERVVRAVARSQIPVISGVGHEPDITLIDYVADKRAPTPTAAAEIAVPVRADLRTTLRAHQQRLTKGLTRHLYENEQRLDDRGARFSALPPLYFERLGEKMRGLSARLRTPQQVLDKETLKLATLLNRRQIAQKMYFKERTQGVASRAQLLESYSYEAVLKRGFAVVARQNGHYLKRAQDAKPSESVRLIFSDGPCDALLTPGGPAPTAIPSGPSGAVHKPPSKPTRKKKVPDTQESFW